MEGGDSEVDMCDIRIKKKTTYIFKSDFPKWDQHAQIIQSGVKMLQNGCTNISPKLDQAL